MNRQPYGIPPRWWEPQLSPWFVRQSRGFRARQIRRQRIVHWDVQGGSYVREALDKNHGVLVCSNHAFHFDSAVLYLAADHIDTPVHFMTAWQVFAMSRWWERWCMQRLGCFSVNREGHDRAALKQAVAILTSSPYPLVIFPEGDIYHVSDFVTPFREGAAAIALSAARKAERPIVIVPCALRCRYLTDPLPSLNVTVAELEDRLYLHAPANHALVDRILRVSEAAIALKEIDHLGHTRSGPPTRSPTTIDRTHRGPP